MRNAVGMDLPLTPKPRIKNKNSTLCIENAVNLSLIFIHKYIKLLCTRIKDVYRSASVLIEIFLNEVCHAETVISG